MHFRRQEVIEEYSALLLIRHALHREPSFGNKIGRDIGFF
jgi:hypothetical protein